MKTRAERRHHEQRMRAKVRKNYEVQQHRQFGEDHYKEVIARRATTRKPCSCWMCGNPRKFFGEKTIQEKRAEFNEQ